MRKRKKTKTVDDLSVSELLDDFVDLAEEDSKRTREMDDDEYIRMMVEKENQRKQERVKRDSQSGTYDEVQSPPSEEIVPRPSEPELDKFAPTCESDMSPEDEANIDEIMKTQDTMDEPALAGRMKASVEFLQDEVKSSESKSAARKTLEKYRKDPAISTGKERAPIISEKRAPIKRCQNCYFCVKEKKVSGSCWCHCSNPGRSTHAVAKGSWVKSRMNLPCWKAPED